MADINVTITEPEDINVTLAEPEDISVTLDQVGITNFLQLHDTPTSFTGEGGNFVRVKSSEDGVEFVLSSSNVAWGEITGTLSNQADIQAELDLKEENLTFSTGLTRSTNTITVNNSELTLTASQVSDFDTEVGNNSSVSANTTHRSSDGSDHLFIDQDVTSGASPTFDDIKINSRVYLDFTSDSYFEYNNSTSEVELYVGGSIKASW